MVSSLERAVEGSRVSLEVKFRGVLRESLGYGESVALEWERWKMNWGYELYIIQGSIYREHSEGDMKWERTTLI